MTLSPKEIEVLQSVDVMSKPVDTESKEIEDKIAQIKERIVLDLLPTYIDRIEKHATHQKMSVEDYCVKVLMESLDEEIGKPTITGPSRVNGQTLQKVTGPSWMKNTTTTTNDQ